MTDPSDRYPLHDLPPAIQALQSQVEASKARVEQLEQYLLEFAEAMELVSDLSKVNEILEQSPRPDLVMSEPAAMVPLDSRDGDFLRKVDNFLPNMRAFGTRDAEGSSYYIPATDDELEQYFMLGARGNNNDGITGPTVTFLKNHPEIGIDESRCQDMCMQTHMGKPAFIRMWILFPELTKHLIRRCTRERGRSAESIHAEISIAYELMSRLVDTGDTYVARNGTANKWYLCA